MAEHRFDSHNSDFAAAAELLCSADSLPTLSRRLRARVLDAATSAYRQARRWTQAREAASLLSVCLLTSFVMSPVANFSLPSFASPFDVGSTNSMTSVLQPNSAWTLRHDREFLGLPHEKVEAALADQSEPQQGQAPTCPTQIAALHAGSPPSDNLLTTLHSSDGWATVQAFQAVRSRSHSTLQRAFAAN